MRGGGGGGLNDGEFMGVVIMLAWKAVNKAKIESHEHCFYTGFSQLKIKLYFSLHASSIKVLFVLKQYSL